MLPEDARAKVKALRADLDRVKKVAPAKYPVIHTLADASRPTDMPVFIRGNADTPGPKVGRGFLSALGGDKPSFNMAAAGSSLPCHRERGQSADRPCDGQPCLATSFRPRSGGHVQQLWHAGRSARAIPSCSTGWLSRFVESGWSIKTLHRTIMLSATYRQSSRLNAKASRGTPTTLLLWRTNRRRLDVEAWRDAMLAVAGRLDAINRRALGQPGRPSNHRRTLLRCDQPARPRLDASTVRLSRPQYHERCAGPRRRSPATALCSQQRVHAAQALEAVAAQLLASRQPGHSGRRAAFARPTCCSMAGCAAAPSSIWASLIFTPGIRATRARRSLPAPGRWQRYTQALLAANEFLFID